MEISAEVLVAIIAAVSGITSAGAAKVGHAKGAGARSDSSSSRRRGVGVTAADQRFAMCEGSVAALEQELKTQGERHNREVITAAVDRDEARDEAREMRGKLDKIATDVHAITVSQAKTDAWLSAERDIRSRRAHSDRPRREDK